MTAITVRVLGEEDWQLYRAVRLDALQDSPEAFLHTYDEESAYDEDYWRARMRRSQRLVAEQDGHPQGTVSVGFFPDDPRSADVFGLWVAPDARHTGTAWRLVEAAAALAADEGCTQLFYWVGTENGRGIAFASNFGFRLTSRRRPIRVQNPDFGDQEIAFVLSLEGDPAAVPNVSGVR
ncbi:MAG TPA: GNAT family N-acetyltransferase [Propionibacteriaceae bacterium]|nr:GNAT family N-acetyltransferase [Propionibacteriaceae bacterium]